MKNLIEYFEGFVDDADATPKSKTFWVRLVDLDDEEFTAEMLTSQVPFVNHRGREEIQPGLPFTWEFYQLGDTYWSEFKWVIEYWTQEELDRARREAEELVKFFKRGEVEDENN